MPQMTNSQVIQYKQPLTLAGAVFQSAVGPALGAIGSAAGAAAGGFLHEDPREAGYLAASEGMRNKQRADLLDGWQKYAQDRGITGTSQEKLAWLKAAGVSDEDQVNSILPAMTDTTLTKDMAAQTAPHDVIRNSITGSPATPFASNDAPVGPFAATPGAGPMAEAFPGMGAGPATTETTAVTPAGMPRPVEVVMPVGAGSEVGSSSAAVERDAIAKEAGSPVIAPTTSQPVPTQPTNTPAPPLPAQVTPEQKAYAMKQMTQLQGMISFFGQTAAAAQKGEINPAQRNAALAAINSSDADISDIVNLGRISTGLDPASPGINHADLAYRKSMWQLGMNQAFIDTTPPAQVKQVQDIGKGWTDFVTSGRGKSYDFDAIGKLEKQVGPEGIGGAAYMQYASSRHQVNTQRDVETRGQDINREQFAANHELNRAKLSMEQQKLTADLGISAQTLLGMKLSNADAASLVGMKAQEFKQHFAAEKQRMEQSNEAFGLGLNKMQLENLTASQALANVDVDRAMKFTGIIYEGEQKRALQLQTNMDHMNATLQKTSADWNKNSQATMVQIAVDKYAGNPQLAKDDYNKDAALKPKVDAIMQTLAQANGRAQANGSELGQALVAAQNPAYEDYLTQTTRLSTSIAAADTQIRKIGENDVGLLDTYKKIKTQLTGENGFDTAKKHSELTNEYLNQQVITKQKAIAEKGIKGQPDSVAQQFIVENPTYVPYLLNQAVPKDGSLVVRSLGFSPPQVAAFLVLARHTRTPEGHPMTEDAFSNMAIRPGVTFGKYLGKDVHAAYNVYAQFAQGGY